MPTTDWPRYVALEHDPVPPAGKCPAIRYDSRGDPAVSPQTFEAFRNSMVGIRPSALPHDYVNRVLRAPMYKASGCVSVETPKHLSRYSPSLPMLTVHLHSDSLRSFARSMCDRLVASPFDLESVTFGSDWSIPGMSVCLLRCRVVRLERFCGFDEADIRFEAISSLLPLEHSHA